jgi:predicted amino acid-binding ACT domain protein
MNQALVTYNSGDIILTMAQVVINMQEISNTVFFCLFYFRVMVHLDGENSNRAVLSQSMLF